MLGANVDSQVYRLRRIMTMETYLVEHDGFIGGAVHEYQRMT